MEPSGHSLHFDVIYEGAAPLVRAHLCQNGQSCMKAQQLTGPAPLHRGRPSAVAVSAAIELHKAGSRLVSPPPPTPALPAGPPGVPADGFALA